MNRIRVLLLALLVVLATCSYAVVGRSSTKPSEEPTASIVKVSHVAFAGEITDATAVQIGNTLNALSGISKYVILEFNSPGGSVDAGFYIVKTIERSESVVVCVVDGVGASMAFYILQSCDVRVMTDRSILMIHEPSEGGKYVGKSSDWRKTGNNVAELLEVLTKAMNRHMSRRLYVSYEDFSKRIHDTEYWLDSEEAAKIGAVDDVVQSVGQVEEKIQQL